MATKLHRTDLPLKLVNSLNNSNVTFLTAPPAYGKSVLLIDVLSSHPKKSIIVIPNRTSVMLLHTYTSKLYHNKKIGYRMSNDSESSKFDDVTLITTGYFLEWITYNKKVMSNPLTLVIDEAHFSDEQTDLVIRIALHQRMHNKNLKVILSSATLDIDRYRTFVGRRERIDMITLSGGSPNVKIEYVTNFKQSKSKFSKLPRYSPPSKPPEGPEGTEGNVIINLLTTKLNGINTLIICAGENEIYSVKSDIENSKNPILQNVIIKELYSKLDHEDITDALTIGEGWTVILATNIVESSVTIKIDAVIDFGKRKLVYSDSKGRVILKTCDAAKSNIIQALARCGRGEKMVQGFVLMSKNEYDRLEDFPEPEVYRNLLYNQIIRLIRAELPIREIFKEKELQDNLEDDMMLMRSHGIIKKTEKNNYQLTPIGKIISKVKLSLLSNKFLIDVILHEDPDIWYYALLIATWIDLTDPIFYKPKRKYKEPEESYIKRCSEIMSLYYKYKEGIDCLDEILLITLDIFEEREETGETGGTGGTGGGIDINIKKLNNSGLNSKTMKSWKKIINFTTATLCDMGYIITYKTTSNEKNSDMLRSRLTPYLHGAFNDSFYEMCNFMGYKGSLKGSLKVDNNCNYDFNVINVERRRIIEIMRDNDFPKEEIDEYKNRYDPNDYNNYIFGLNTFSTGNSDIISKIIRCRSPILSDTGRILMYVNLKIPIEIWEQCIFTHLSMKDILNVYTAARF